MLEICITSKEYFNEENNEFVYSPETVLKLEHSLYSVSLWESKYKKPFLSDAERTTEETLDYIKMMTLNKESVENIVYHSISKDEQKQIIDYIGSKMTATKFTEIDKPKHSGSYLSAEIIYYYMTALNIPFECQYWHLDRLMTLIRVCNEKQQPPKKRPKRDIYNRNTKLNAARRAALHSKG